MGNTQILSGFWEGVRIAACDRANFAAHAGLGKGASLSINAISRDGNLTVWAIN